MAILGIWLACARAAWGQEAPDAGPRVAAPERDIVIPERAIDRDADPAAPDAARARRDPGFVTVVHVSGRGELQAVAEVLAESVGAHVKSFGGLGSFASLSLRGAPAAQTEILIDGVPLSRVASASLDVGSIDLGTYDRVEIYRGGVPVAYGGAALGGAVNFVTPLGPDDDGRRNMVTVGGGSFGARRTRLLRRDALDRGRLRTAIGLGYAGADGDYTIFDDHGTPLNASDDGTHARANNGFDQLDGVGRFELATAAQVTDAGERVSWKTQGVPGPAGAEAHHASLATLRSVTDVKTERRRALGIDALDLGASAYVVAERQRYADPDGEIGLAMQDETYLTLSSGGALTSRVAVGRRQTVAASLDGRVEWFQAEDHLKQDASATGDRLAGALSLSDEVALGAHDEVLLIPALRADAVVTRPGSAGAMITVIGTAPPGDRGDLYLSPRLGARWAVTPALSVKANLGRYFRAPTLVELFGDHGFVIGNPALTPESGTTGDVGVVLAPHAAVGGGTPPVDRLYLECAIFASRANDLIALVPTSGRVAIAKNLGDARIGGVELAASLRAWRTVTLTGNYTFLDTSQQSPLVSFDGKRLPGRPRHEAYLRVEIARRVTALRRVVVGGWIDASLDDGNFLDAGNLNRVPARRFVGLGARVTTRGGVTATLEVKNLFDSTVEQIPLDANRTIPRAVADVLGYPLPGRAIYGALQWSF